MLEIVICLFLVLGNLWKKFSGSCVNGSTIVKYTNKSVDECKKLCWDYVSDVGGEFVWCRAFEYGIMQKGGAGYKQRDCILKASLKKEDCDGAYYNLDLYVLGKFIYSSGIIFEITIEKID